MARREEKWRDRMKNNADVTRIVTYNCRKMAICCFLLLCIKVSWRHLANLKQMLRICALLALVVSVNRVTQKQHGRKYRQSCLTQLTIEHSPGILPNSNPGNLKKLSQDFFFEIQSHKI